jgi:hypothetical protein
MAKFDFNAPIPNMSNEPRSVTIEPQKPPQTKAKVFVALVSGKFDKVELNEGETLRLMPEVALPLLESRRLVPLSIAINLGIYPPKKTTLAGKLKAAVSTVVGDTEPAESTTIKTQAPEKSFLANKLREAIQAKKAKTPKPKGLTAEKLAAIRAGGKK